MRKTITALTCIGLLIVALAGAIIFVKTAPKAQKRRPPKMAPTVETQPLTPTRATVVLELAGTVVPAEEVLLRSRVGGEIISMAKGFIDGGLLQKGDEVLKIDPVDYELALVAAEAKLSTAQFNYKMELGRHDVARCEWEQLKSADATEQEQELALRTPHLAASKAALQAAEAALKKAKLDLSRTQIRSPFNAVVLDRNVNVGSQTTPSGQLARLAGTDAYWVKVSIAVDRLPWLKIPGAKATVVSTSGAVRQGRVIRLLGNLETKGRMARVLVEINDPLCLKPQNQQKKPLLLGEYVQVKIQGRQLDGVYDIPRNTLHEGDQVWTVNGNKLEIHEAEVLWRSERRVLLRAPFPNGATTNRLIVSNLTTPIQGMEISTGKKTKKKAQTPPSKKHQN
jgi:RND family efflux transporter MFP subunit